MGTILRQEKQILLAISLIAALFALTVACGGSSAESPVQTPANTAIQTDPNTSSVITPTPVPPTALSPTSALSEQAADEPPVMSTTTPVAQAPQATEPVLINTPVPVATDLAPGFTLPSIQGTEYTLEEFRGVQPVLVVFYRAYW